MVQWILNSDDKTKWVTREGDYYLKVFATPSHTDKIYRLFNLDNEIIFEGKSFDDCSSFIESEKETV